MGLTKNYLRYVHDKTFGLTAVGSAIKFLHIKNTKDRYVAVPANEDVIIWDLKTNETFTRLTYEAEVTQMDCYHGGHARTNLIAVGYANGHIRVFEYETGGLKVTFVGHRTSISALTFDQDGSRIASGAKDCTIALWDLISEKGMFSLKGHKNSITKLAFLQRDQKDILVSSSADAVASLKFWDLQTQYCFQTIPAHSSGVWSFVILKDGTRLVAGSSSPELKVYSIEFYSSLSREEEEAKEESQFDYGLRVRQLGNILRNSSTVSNRVQDIVLDQDGTFMICHSIDKTVELYGIRSNDEALSYAKKQAKKASRKAKRKEMDEDGELDGNEADPNAFKVTSLGNLDCQRLVDCEFNRKYDSQRLSDKIKAAAITKLSNKRYKVAFTFSSNKLESFHVNLDASDPQDLFNQLSMIENQSHRTDVRSVAISSDNKLLLSASGDSVKIWRLESTSCLTTVETDYGLCCSFADAQNLLHNYQNRFALIGTKKGQIQIIDISSASIIQTIDVCNEGKPLNSIYILPDKSGIVCGGEDGIARFYNYVWQTTTDEDSGQKQVNLSLEPDRTLPFQEGITCVKISANSKFLAIALLDSTVRIHFLDTFKYFLTMYGHKFPVTTMDISDDNTLLVTGSPDKNIKIWGMDFGDCHRSIFAHDDAITCVKFVPKTHYIFSCGRDKSIKQYDCDHFIKIQTLPKHQAEIWCLDISPNGKFIVTGSHDKSMRIYRKTEEIIVPADEEETERELEDERNTFEKQDNIIIGEDVAETGFAPKMTIDTIKSTDRLIESIDVYESEHAKHLEYVQLCELADKKGEPRPAEPERDPLLMTVMTTDYHRFILEILRRTKSSELEEILLTLPFNYVGKLLIIIVTLLERNWDVELMVRCATFLLRINYGQIAASPPLVPVMYKLKSIILDRVAHLRNCAGFNSMALEHLSLNKRYVSTKTNLFR